MVPVLDRELLQSAPTRPVNWRGRSGRFYALASERLEHFAARRRTLPHRARPDVLWAGAVADLVVTIR